MVRRMRARLQKFLPIVLLALVMQVLAPIAACWAAGQAVADPLAAGVICHSVSEQGGPNDQTGSPTAHAGACALCCLAQANASLRFAAARDALHSLPPRRARGVARGGCIRCRCSIRAQAPRRGDLPTFPDLASRRGPSRWRSVLIERPSEPASGMPHVTLRHARGGVSPSPSRPRCVLSSSGVPYRKRSDQRSCRR